MSTIQTANIILKVTLLTYIFLLQIEDALIKLLEYKVKGIKPVGKQWPPIKAGNTQVINHGIAECHGLQKSCL